MIQTRDSRPSFPDEEAERSYWETKDSADLVDWPRAERVRFPNLKPTTRSIALRPPISLLDQIKVEANRRDVSYQSLIKTWLTEKLG